jgi:hypothetical protein
MRKRGLAKTDYAGSTLREALFGEGNKHLPANHHGSELRVGRS